MIVRLLAPFLGAALLTLPAAAMESEITFGLGYSQLALPSNSNNNLDGRGGVRFDLRFSTPINEDYEQLRLGGGLTLSGYSEWHDEEGYVIIDGEIYYFEADTFESISLFIPEFIVSWMQPLGEDGWYVEPGIALGLVIGTYSTGASSYWYYDYDEYETDINVSARPHVRVGYTDSENDGDGGWVAGVELSFLWGGELDFDDAGESDIQEFYIGAYGGARF